MSNNWTASTTTSWIFFDRAYTLTAITGTGGDSITIYVIPATKPTDVAKGSITIVTESGVIEKEIIRCVPKITGETKSLSCKINGCDFDDDDCTITVSPCVNGTGGNYNGINITDIVLTIIQNLSDGKTNKITQNLYLSDVDVTYTTEGNVTSTVLTENNGKARPVLVTVTYKNDRSVFIQKTITQAGLIKENGDYDDTKFVKTGYSDSNVYYQNFNFNSNCRDYTTSSCQGGTFEFSCSGNKVTVRGGKTGKTICNKTVSIGGGDSPDSEPISSSDVSYSVSPGAEDGNYFTNNTLTYSSNENRSQNKSLTIYATLIPDNQTITTTFTIVAGTDCGNPLYIQITSNKKAISFESETVEIRYYLTETPTGGESNAVRDESIISCLNLSCPNGVNCGTQTVSDGVFRRTVTFPKNTSEEREGINWTFTATCESAENNPATLTIYQASKYENIIPNCDYFVFRYIWSSSDGKDLDSLTHITNVPTLMARNGSNVSGQTVGFGGTSVNYGLGAGVVVLGENSVLYLKHGGDNRCSGAEGAIICLKNILNSGQVSNDDEIWIDIYACWWETKGLGHMSFEYEQFTGLTDGGYDEQIREVLHNDCKNYIYYTFEPIENKCERITGETIQGINVNAAGRSNHNYAENINCIDGAYTHVVRLVYNVKGKRTSLQTFTVDNGANLFSDHYAYFYNINGEMKSASYRYTGTTASTSYTYNDFYIKQKLDDATYDFYPFDEENDEIEIVEYTQDVNVGWWTEGQKRSIKKSNVDAGDVYNLDYITNFKIIKNSDKTIKISFDCSELPSGNIERNFDIHFKKLYGRTIFSCYTGFEAYRISIFQLQE